MKLYIQNKGTIKAESSDLSKVELFYQSEYVEGDCICFDVDRACYVMLQLEDTLRECLVYATKEYAFQVPFLQNKNVYSQKCFSGNQHLLTARIAQPWEINCYKNLAYNPYDSHNNNGIYPHSVANVETRGEAVFASANAINGNVANHSHGTYPYESWGINRQDDAEFTIDFGREVVIDRMVITIRCDFPHDNWWKTVTIKFSNGKTQTFSLKKVCQGQGFVFTKQKCTSITLCNMKKDELDESPFPALTQIEFWGNEKQIAK